MFERRKQGVVNVIAGGLPLAGEGVEIASTTLEECLADGQPKAVLDLQHVPIISSAGLEMMLDVKEAFEDRAGALKIAAPNALCADILDVTGLSSHFEVYDEVNAAIGSFLH